MSEELLYQDCEFGEPHQHVYPADWIFGGASGTDPRSDPRWKPTNYEYYDDKARLIWSTHVQICDEEAIDYFTFVASIGPDWKPVWVAAKRPDGSVEMLPVEYDKITDTAYAKVAANASQ